MTIGKLEDELKKLHPEFQVLVGRNTDQTAGVFFRGERLFTIPNNNIYDKPIDAYGVETSTGFIRHRTIGDALAMAKKVLQEMKEGGEDYRATMGLGEFSEAKLAPSNEQATKGGIIVP